MKAKNAKKTSTRTTRKTTKLKTAARSIPHRVASKTDSAGAMSRELAKVVTKLKSLKRQLGLGWKRDALITYEFGAAVEKVMRESAKFGAKAVEKLSADLKLDKATLYRWAKVATTWTKADFAEIAARRSPKTDMPLTWSHLELLSDEVNAKRRGKLVEQALSEALTVVELRALIKGGPARCSVRSLPVASAGTSRTDVWNRVHDLVEDQAELVKVLSRIPTAHQTREHVDQAKTLYASCEKLMAAIKPLATTTTAAPAEAAVTRMVQ